MPKGRGIPEEAWKRRLDKEHVRQTFARPPLEEIITLLPVAWRVGSYVRNERNEGREPIFNLSGAFLKPPDPGPEFGGVPCGGIGAGAIGRGWRGDFNRWSLRESYVHHSVEADRFYLRVKRGDKVYSQMLLPASIDGDANAHSAGTGLQKFMPAGNVEYHALFPRSWTVFDQPVPGVKVILKQLSPFLPGSYSEASLPAVLFGVEVINLVPNEPIEASVMFAFQNGFDEHSDSRGGFEHKSFAVNCENEDEDHNCGISGVSMSHHRYLKGSKLGNPEYGSYSVAADGRGNDCSVTNFKQFVINTHPPDSLGSFFPSSCCCLLDYLNSVYSRMDGDAQSRENPNSMIDCLSLFHQTGTLDSGERDHADSPLKHSDTSGIDISKPGQVVGTAVCLKKLIRPGESETFSFALAWDNPWVRFGSPMAQPVPRYYTKFFGRSGTSAASIASYALLNANAWEERIIRWQAKVLNGMAETLGKGESVPEYYKHQLFNELYFLVDGGTIWTDSSGGVANCRSVASPCPSVGDSLGRHPVFACDQTGQSQIPPAWHSAQLLAEPDINRGFNAVSLFDSDELKCCPDTDPLSSLPRDLLSNNYNSPTPPPSAVTEYSDYISHNELIKLAVSMAAHDARVISCSSGVLGDSRLVGQFLYLEGHEYFMYNTYDVHFYAGFALAQLWPQLEFSLQRDVAAAIDTHDPTVRVMMGTGSAAIRKSKGCVPHDLGSPSEAPWSKVNAYNFQDVSKWRDLGPKFVLQVYRNYLTALRSCTPIAASQFLQDMYTPTREVLAAMEAFDCDKDGMIENSGQPDQTYDIWVAEGITAYCGGLYIAALFAASAIATGCKDDMMAKDYFERAQRAKRIYRASLWNGLYLNYDTSGSAHSDSIMADMLAGQWWTRVCELPPVLSPQDALSCYQTIYKFNVIRFAGICSPQNNGRNTPLLVGAVNGMRPNGTIDQTCLQSREVWTGTTYGLAAAMLHESFADKPGKEEVLLGKSPLQTTPLNDEQRQELRNMAFTTAQGIHDAGWQRFGYWFATPEAWTASGDYRSLGYMRPLAIWAMQFACAPESRGAI